MVLPANAEMLLLTLGLVSFLALLVGLTAALSIARQMRVRLTRRAGRTIQSVFEADTLPSLPGADTRPSVPSYYTLAKLRDAVRDTVNEPVTLSIEPENGPTRQQRNVQRLIEYLKEESTKAPASASTV